MEPERLIIELIRDGLRAAWEEYTEAKAEQSYIGGFSAVEQEYKPERIEDRLEQHRRTSVAQQTARLAVENWDKALTVALDKLYQ